VKWHDGRMTENGHTLRHRLGRALGFKSKATRATEKLAARDQAREIERLAEGEHAPGNSEEEGERGGHRYLRP
jgi:hypothetical protein